MKNEVKELINDFKNNKKIDVVATFESDLKRHKDVLLLLQNIQGFERPDAYSIVDGVLYIIEFFKFDCSKTTKKGSRTKTTIAEESRDVLSILEEVKKYNAIPENADGVMLNIPFTQDGCVDNLLKSFKKGFTDHYCKLDEYKKNLLNKLNLSNISIKNVFICVDESFDPTCRHKMFESDIDYVPVLASSEFMDFYKNYTNVDIVFIVHRYSSVFKVSYMTKESVNNVPYFSLYECIINFPTNIVLKRIGTKKD